MPPRKMSKALEALVRQLPTLVRPDQLRQRADVCRAILGRIGRHEQSELWTITTAALIDTLLESPTQGSDDMEEAITRAVDLVSQDIPANIRAHVQDSLGVALVQRTCGDRAANLERAIEYHHQALAHFSRATDPTGWATTHHNLAVAYLARIGGEHADNVEQAIAHFKTALDVFTQYGYPERWVHVQNSLGVAYRGRVIGDPGENVEKAIEHHQLALKSGAAKSPAESLALNHLNLGELYSRRTRGDRGENVECALKHLHAAVALTDRDVFPARWAMILEEMAMAYSGRPQGEHTHNVDRALAVYQQSLDVLSRESQPKHWARIQRLMGELYATRAGAHEGQDRDHAVRHLRAALQVAPPEADAGEYMVAQRALINLLGEGGSDGFPPDVLELASSADVPPTGAWILGLIRPVSIAEGYRMFSANGRAGFLWIAMWSRLYSIAIASVFLAAFFLVLFLRDRGVAIFSSALGLITSVAVLYALVVRLPRRLPAIRELRAFWWGWRRNAQETVLLHNNTVRLVGDCLLHGRPFGIFLRSFRTEALEHRSSEGHSWVYNLQRPVEHGLADALADRLPLVALRNPLEDPLLPWELPRIHVAAAKWEDVVKHLASDAYLIVLDCPELSPGISEELKIIAQLGRQESTVVIMPSQDEAASDRDDYLEGFGVSFKRLKHASPTMSSLPSFSRVVFANQISYADLDSCEAFKGLLSELPDNSRASVSPHAVAVATELPWARYSAANGQGYSSSRSSRKSRQKLLLEFMFFGRSDDLLANLRVLDRYPHLLTDQADGTILAFIVHQLSIGEDRLAHELAGRLALLRRTRMVGLKRALIDFRPQASLSKSEQTPT